IEWAGSHIEPRAGKANFQGCWPHGELRGHSRIRAARGDDRPRNAGVAGDGAPGTSAVLQAGRGCEDRWTVTGLDRTRSSDTRSVSDGKCPGISRSGRVRLKRGEPE